MRASLPKALAQEIVVLFADSFACHLIMFTRRIGNGEERSIDCSPVAAWARTRVGMIRGQRTVYPKLYQLYHALGMRLSKKTRGSSSRDSDASVRVSRRRLHAKIVNFSGTGKSRMVDKVAKYPALCVGATLGTGHIGAPTLAVRLTCP